MSKTPIEILNAKRKKMGLILSAVWIDKDDKKKLRNYAKRLRKQAGKPLPRDV